MQIYFPDKACPSSRIQKVKICRCPKVREFTGFWAPPGCRKFYTSFYVKMAPRRRETRVIQSFLLLGYGWRVKPYPKSKFYKILKPS